MTVYDYLVVGAGITGITAASILAGELGKRVALVEKMSHIGGSCYDCYDDSGVFIHKYGPHIFHTQHEDVWQYLSRFTKWLPYIHHVMAWVDEKYVSLPVSLKSFRDFFGHEFTPDEMKAWIEKDIENIPCPANSEEMILSRMGRHIYEKIFRNYTKKQWGVDARELAPQVTARIPIRFNNDDRFFSDPYQGIPEKGYTSMFEAMLGHGNIDLVLDVDYKQIVKDISFNRMIYTGPVDYFFDYQFGPLPYRGINYTFISFDKEKIQPVAVVNYPNDYDYTRSTEFKHMTMQKHPFTTICYEYPEDCVQGMDIPVPAYPLLSREADVLYRKYKKNVDTLKSVIFLGRLAQYQYYNMDNCVKAVIDHLG